MASWLKAAEGLLEAVDKSVSKTVGTLGLAEGEAPDTTFQGEFAAPAAGGPPTGAPRAQPATGQATSYTSYGYQQPHPGTSQAHYVGSSTHVGLAAGSAYPPSSASGPASTGGRGAAGGFTVKSDAPIPFGSKPPAPPPSTYIAGISPSSSQGALSGLGGVTPSTGSSVAPAAPAYMPQPAASISANTIGTERVSGSGSPGAGAGSTAAGTPYSAVAAVAATAPNTALGPSSAAAPLVPKQQSQLDATQGLTAGVQHGSGSAAKAATVAGSSPDSAATAVAPPTSAPGTAAATSTSAVLPVAAGSSMRRAGSSSGDVGDTGQKRASGSGEPVAGSSSAATAAVTPGAAAAMAAATLASATAAVTNSLSFFNLVGDESEGGAAPGTSASAPGAGAVDGGSGGAAAGQVQALTRTVEQLRKRLEASRLENEQLEDMLARAEVKAQQEAALVASLREELSGLQQSRASSESSLAAQLSVAKASLADVAGKYEASQRQVLLLEGQLAALEESSRRLMEQHNDREGGMLDALRAELSSAESRLAAERKAHQASRVAAAARESDLEAQIAGSTAALGDLTRSLEDANRKARALEEEVVAATRGRNDLAAQVQSLQRQLADAGIEVDSGTGPDGDGVLGVMRSPGLAAKSAAAAAAAAAEMEVLRGELSHHKRAAELAKQAAEAGQAQVAAMTAELEALRHSIEQRKDTAQLEAQLREMSDMLYLKQTQLERLAAEKAAQQLKTERELDSVRQELAKLTRATVGQGGGGGSGLPTSSLASAGGGHDVIPMDALGEPYQRLARNNKVGKAVKAAANFLDSTASTTSYVLRQYPLVRLGVFAYVVLIHLYVYLLIARMQRMATHWEASISAAPVVT